MRYRKRRNDKTDEMKKDNGRGKRSNNIKNTISLFEYVFGRFFWQITTPCDDFGFVSKTIK